MRKVVVDDEMMRVFGRMDPNGPVVADLRRGAVFTVGAEHLTGKFQWAEVTLPDGRTGYVFGSGRVTDCRRALVNEDVVGLHGAPRSDAPVIAQLPRGTRLELRVQRREGALVWVEAVLPDGRMGFVPGNAQVAVAHRMHIDQPAVIVRAAPSADAPVVTRLAADAAVYTFAPVTSSSGTWVEIEGPDGRAGFIPANTRLAQELRPAPPRVQRASWGPLIAEGIFVVALVAIYFGLPAPPPRPAPALAPARGIPHPGRDRHPPDLVRHIHPLRAGSGGRRRHRRDRRSDRLAHRYHGGV